MKKSIKKLLYASIIGLLVIGGVKTARAIFYPVQVQQFYLCGSGSTIGDTTICLQSFNDIAGNQLTMTAFGSQGFGTIDPNNGSQEESVTFTGVTQNANGTATLTGVNSISFYQPFVLTGNITKNHAGAATFVISNTSYFYDRMYINADDPTLPQNVATKHYVDGAAFGGIGGASETATGTVQIATNLQAASSTKNGSIGRLAIPASISTSTFNPNTAALSVVVTQNSGKIDNNFISTSSLFTNAAFATTTNIGSFPAYQIGKNATTTAGITSGTSTFAVPAGVTMLYVRMVGGGGQGSSHSGATGGGAGGSGAYSEGYVNVTGTTSIQYAIGSGNNLSANTPGGDTWFGTPGFAYLMAGGGKGASGGASGAGGIGSIIASTTGFTSAGNAGVPGATVGGGTGSFGVPFPSVLGASYGAAGNNGETQSDTSGFIIISW